MIYLRIVGRLGNQLFQYSFARKLQEASNQKIAVDFQEVLKWEGIEGRRGYENYLKYFNLDYIDVTGQNYCICKKAVCDILHKLKPRKSKDKLEEYYLWVARKLSTYGIFYMESSKYFYDFYDNLISRKNYYLKGWFESPKYFSSIDDILKSEFTLKTELKGENKLLFEKIKSHEMICLSIRCWGFEDSAEVEKNQVCTQKYYEQAVKYILSQHPKSMLYVCSDNIEWCKKNLNFDKQCYFEPNNHPTVKLILMTACNYFIISNSTFSWWAQHLSQSKNKIVVAPSVWRKNVCASRILYENNWICMNENGDIV